MCCILTVHYFEMCERRRHWTVAKLSDQNNELAIVHKKIKCNFFSNLHLYSKFHLPSVDIEENMNKWQQINGCSITQSNRMASRDHRMIRSLLLGFKFTLIGESGSWWCPYFTSLCSVLVAAFRAKLLTSRYGRKKKFHSLRQIIH